MFAYVGSRTTRERQARGDGISVYHCDERTGALRLVQVHGDLVNPSYLALNQTQDRLYVVHGDGQTISAFRVQADGQITWINQQDTGGKNPVHLALDTEQKHVVVSNHITSSLAVLSLCEDGALGTLQQLIDLQGQPGPHRLEQPFAKPHFNVFDPSGRHVVVPDKGLDRVFTFPFEQGRLVEERRKELVCREASGPRHIAFHPLNPWAYVINELNSTVTCCHWDHKTGQLTAFQVLSALADTFVGNSRASEIAVHPGGHTVYASNRGEDSLAVFAVDPHSGRLSLQQTVPSGGRTPRFFALSPNGLHLYVLNEDSDSIERFAVHARSGELEASDQRVACGSPVCMVFADGVLTH